ncbi:hypothetical protein KP509_04G041700 [Ceratopteris richardii]|uniref:Uncharacterized protein n=1 Tax=Ceratopteris richardii TaxID=49495 RepID=A0A8T2UWC1_CERRI|nr:hypothetical protein KP509_04G041700 [Ceratopteris richardii]
MSRIGFSDECVAEMEGKFQKAFFGQENSKKLFRITELCSLLILKFLLLVFLVQWLEARTVSRCLLFFLSNPVPTV